MHGNLSHIILKISMRTLKEKNLNMTTSSRWKFELLQHLQNLNTMESLLGSLIKNDIVAE